MKRTKIFAFLMTFCLLFSLLAVPAHADIGPKPSVRVRITGLEDQTYVVTLLSEASSTGPASAYDGTNALYTEGENGYAMWKRFVEYEDADGFYFLQQFHTYEGNSEYVWGYYPPHTFKVLFYFPEYDRFIITVVQERYAFDSYFLVDFSRVNISGQTADGMYIPAEKAYILAEKDYDYTWEMISLAARILLTILLEMALAWAFRYRGKKLFLFIVCANAVTQIALNLILNVVNFRSGPWAFAAYYAFLEVFVFAIEAVAYAVLFPMLSKGEKRVKAVLYALAANALSFGAGFALACVIPGIF